MPEDWRRVGRTIGAMEEFGWAVLSVCRSCHLTMEVDLKLMIRVKGADFDLWNQQSKCKRLGCKGTVEFQAKPPEAITFFALRAEWVEK